MATAEEENSLFGSSICLPELLPLMPLAVAAHPRQLSAGQENNVFESH